MKTLYLAIYIAALAATVVGVDVLFFKDRAGARLIANICIVAAFGAVYLILRKVL